MTKNTTRDRSAAKTEALHRVRLYLADPLLPARVSATQPYSPQAHTLQFHISAINPALNSLETIIDFALTADTANSQPSPIAVAFAGLKERLVQAKQGARALSTSADHREKRRLIHDFRFHIPPRSIHGMIATQGRDDVGTLLNPRIVELTRAATDRIGLRKVLADTKCRPQADFIADTEQGITAAENGESVIFVSYGANRQVNIELIALQKIAFDSPFHQELYQWLSAVVSFACAVRRDVRPTHPGAMVQVGWNAGPRHARAFGLAKSWTKTIDPAATIEHDEDVIAAMTLMWGMCRAFLPTEVTSTIDAALEEACLPRIATRNITEGTGYRLNIGGKGYDFPLFERAPCEGFLTQDYSAWTHVDPSYTPWALSWNVERKVDPLAKQAPAPSVSSSQPGVMTRGRSQLQQPGPLAESQEDPSLWPIDGGGHFVDTTLGVKIKQNTGTLIAFHPDLGHGTTRLCGAHNRAVTIAFSSRIRDAFQKASQGVSVESGEGAGEGPKGGD